MMETKFCIGHPINSLRMEKDRNKMTGWIFNLTLEIIYLLTGEDYAIVKKTSGEHVTSRSCPCVSGVWSRTQSPITLPPPHLLIHERNNDQKILDLTKKITQLLIGEVPIRCQDVTVYFSMEEWEYLERHKDQYKDVMMEDHQDVSDINNTPEGFQPPVSSLPSCEGGNLSYISTPIDHTQCPSTPIKEKPVSWEGGNLRVTDIDTPTDRTQCTSSHVKEKPISWEGGNLRGTDICTPTDHTHYTSTPIQEKPASCQRGTDIDTPIDHACISTLIKEKPVSWEGGNLRGTDTCTPTDHTHYTSTPIQEKPASCQRGTDIDTPIDHACISTLIKEKPVSWEGGNLRGTDICTPTDHTHYTSTPIQEKPVSCQRGTDTCTPTDHTHYTSTPIQEKPASCQRGTDIDTPIDHACISTIIKEKPVSWEGGNLRGTNICTPTDHTHYTSTPIQEKPASCERGTEIDTPIDHACISTHIKEKPVSCERGNLRGTNIDMPTDHTQYISINSEGYYAVDGDSQRTSLTGRMYDCSQCHKCFISNSDLVEHQKPHTGHNLTCSECGKSFPSETTSLTHQRTHKGTKAFPCTECGKAFSSAYNLINHERVHTGERPFRCPECGKCFTQKSHLNLHQKIHIGEKPFPCSYCEKRFLVKGNLVTHQKIHTREKPFVCPECGSSFTNVSNFSSHQLTHRREKVYHCSFCTDQFSHKSLLIKHVESHNLGEKPFQCSDCKMCFVRISHLLVHQRVHTGEKPFSCKCGKAYTQKSALNKHLKIHMREEAS